MILAVAMGLEPQTRLSLNHQPVIPHPIKKFHSFAAFYSFYRTEHAMWENQVCHMLGTGLMSLFLLVNPSLIPACVAGLALGLALCPFLLPFEGGSLEIWLVLIVYYAIGFISTRGSVLRPIGPLLVWYAFATFGDFSFASSRTIEIGQLYPSYSFFSDMLMFYDNIIILTQS